MKQEDPMSNIYNKYLLENPGMSNADIAEKILIENPHHGLQRKSIMRRLQYERRLVEVESSNVFSVGETWSFVEDDSGTVTHYKFNVSAIQITEVAAQVVEDICCMYTKPNDLTAHQVSSTLGVEESVVSMVIKHLRITKSSPPFAPHEIANMTDDQLNRKLIDRRRQKIERAISGDSEADILKKTLQEEIQMRRRLEDHIQMLEQSFVASSDRIADVLEASKSAKRDDASDIRTTERIEDGKFVLPNPSGRMGKVETYPRYKTNVFEGRRLSKVEVGNTLHAVLSDWHIGKKTGRFNADVARARCKLLADQICEQALINGAKKIVWHILGDMVDGPSGNMHANQWAHQDVHFQEQIVLASELILEVILAVQKRTGMSEMVCVVGGNHGRFVQERADDPMRMADMLVYKMVLSGLTSSKALASPAMKPGCMIEGDDYYIFNDSGLNVIGHHGDKMAKDPLSVMWELRETTIGDAAKAAKCWVWLYGHLHSNVAEEIQTNCYSLRSGSFAGPDEYSLRIGKGARASQMAFMHRVSNNSISPIWMPLD